MTDNHDCALCTGHAGHGRGLKSPIFSGFGQFSRYILSLGEQADRTLGDQRKRLIAQDFQWGDRAGRDYVDGFCTAFPKFLRPFLVDSGRQAEFAHHLAQKVGLFAHAFNQVHHDAGRIGQGAGNGDSRETRPRSEVDPDLGVRRQRQKLQRVGDVASPDNRKSRRRNEVELVLPMKKQIDEFFQLRLCFT